MLALSCYSYVYCQVHAFGSVPLKTYLPDGDIDLTAFGGPWNDDELAHKVLAVLENEREKHNVDARFIIMDVKLIRAEVCLCKISYAILYFEN